MARLFLVVTILALVGSVHMQGPNQGGGLGNLLGGLLGGQQPMGGGQNMMNGGQMQMGGLADLLMHLPQRTLQMVQNLLNNLLSNGSGQQMMNNSRNPLDMLNQATGLNSNGGLLNQLPNMMGGGQQQQQQQQQQRPQQQLQGLLGTLGSQLDGLTNPLTNSLSQSGLPVNGLTQGLQRTLSNILPNGARV